MLRIILRQFRCWDNIIIEAPIGQITLICGASGAGKSTLLHGITYGLYGNMRMITPNNTEHANTQVIIEFPYVLDNVSGIMKLDRQRGKNRFIITHTSSETRTYEDKVAQALVDELFGKYDIWLASCYIGQGCRNSFLTAPNAGKMEFLNSIAFHEENPSEYIERLDQVITTTNTDYKTKTVLYDQANSNFTKNNEQLTALMSVTDMTKYLTSEQITYVHNTITTKRQELLTLQIQKTKNDNEAAVVHNLQLQLTTVANALLALTIIVPDTVLVTACSRFDITTLQDNEIVEQGVQRLLDIIQLLQKRDDLEIDIRKYNNNVGATNYTMLDYSDALAKETIYRDNQRLSQTLGTTYDANAISNLIARYRALLSAQERIRIETLYDAANKKLTALVLPNLSQLLLPDILQQTIVVPNFTVYNTSTQSQLLTELSSKLGAVQVQIQHLEKGRDVLQCPSCKAHLRHPHSGLILADDAPLNVTELQGAMTDLQNIRLQITQLQQTITRLTREETMVRDNYDRAVVLEQKRVDNLREQARQSQLEQQRRVSLAADYERQSTEIRAQLAEYSLELNKYSEVQGEKRLLTPPEVEHLHCIIAQLTNMVFVELPTTSSAIIRTTLEQQEITQRRIVATDLLQQHMTRISPLYHSEKVATLQLLVRAIREYQQRTRSAVEERNRLVKLQDSLQQQINTRESIVNNTDIITSIMTELEGWQYALTLGSKVNDVLSHRELLVKDQQEIIKQHNILTTIATELADLYNLGQIAIEIECKILQEIVDSINICIESVCSTLFDDISINLSLFKTMKTTGNVKPIVNFNIAYKGGSFDNINQMSGGEGDRASLALTLALNRLSSCPILMLDESLGSLNLSMKESAIRTIRENTTNTVLLIMHDGVEGHFDNVINVDELRHAGEVGEAK